MYSKIDKGRSIIRFSHEYYLQRVNPQILLKLTEIQKLGAYFRAIYPDWKIILLKDWVETDTLFQREIMHQGGGKVLVYAKVEAPRETFQHFRADLESLGERSIGDHFLFLKADVIRAPFEIIAPAGDYPIARRSRFWIEGLALRITEYFTLEGLACLQD